MVLGGRNQEWFRVRLPPILKSLLLFVRGQLVATWNTMTTWNATFIGVPILLDKRNTFISYRDFWFLVDSLTVLVMDDSVRRSTYVALSHSMRVGP